MFDFPLSISLSSLKKSSKKEGKYEKVLLHKILTFFFSNNFNVKHHVSLNFAWGSVLSEIDIIAVKNNNITIVEVKSMNDKISYAKHQFNTIKNFIDYFYVASDRKINSDFFEQNIGLISINNNVVKIRDAKLLNYSIDHKDLLRLKKKCLITLNNGKTSEKYLTKEKISEVILSKYKQNIIKKKVKKILLCHQDCEKCSL